ncbi:hypothetical protein BOTBODRAFT_59633 [Botryobasidium botryosum FD-172 SS1]|uniref:Zn(2)-C6 fungal-type domain-containing protein n=1 Tax=Botryobasidium botryosum (strain FD-172 SS1) TaxID=930990 RepID=A0A067LX84_BOTB1|nr:hypothetical protein BOTBODRAFT_59633 [Botryobasidium botryosum FD-172 SS1]
MRSPTSESSRCQDTPKIRRGVACENCRRKKVACDTGKPTCGNCKRSTTRLVCFYPGSKKTKRLPLLVKKLRSLEAEVGALQAASDLASASEQESWFWGVWDFSSPLFLSVRLNTVANDSLEPRNRVSPPAEWQWITFVDPPPSLSNFLLSAAQTHAFDFSADFDVANMLSARNSRDNSRLAVINALYLLGCYFSPGPLNALEPLFLSRVRRYRARGLEDANRLVDFIKASALLAHYFLFRMRLLEGFDAASTAIRFAFGAGLHDLCPEKYRQAGMRHLLQPVDSELGEYIGVWWQVFALDRGMALLCQEPISISDEKIQTPWPQMGEEYERGNIRYEDNTVLSLYDIRSSAACARGNTPTALLNKSFALYERAARIGSGMVDAEFKATDNAIQRFYSSIPQTYHAIDQPGAIDSAAIFARTFALGSILQLHGQLAQKGDRESHRRCFEAVDGITDIILELKRSQSDDISRLLGTSWLLAREFLERELKRLENGTPADQITAERVRLQLAEVKWAFQKIHEQIGRYTNNIDLTRKRS